MDACAAFWGPTKGLTGSEMFLRLREEDVSPLVFLCLGLRLSSLLKREDLWEREFYSDFTSTFRAASSSAETSSERLKRADYFNREVHMQRIPANTHLNWRLELPLNAVFKFFPVES